MPDETPITTAHEPHEALRRGPLQWFGGKGQLLSRLLPLIPPGGCPYVEPYVGGASVLCARERAPSEVINDLNGDLIRFFRVLQDPAHFRALAHRLRYTLYSRAEFGRALEILASGTEDPILHAWAVFVAANQAFSGIFPADSVGDWSRSFGTGPNAALRWHARVDDLEAWHRRLRHVQIDQRDALTVIQYWDTPDTVCYVDPPYIASTRAAQNMYVHEADDAHHRALVDLLLACQGAVVLSGYDHPIYEPLTASGWTLTRFQTVAYAAGRTRTSGLQGTGAATRKVPRIECVWQNRRALEMLQYQLPMVF